MPESMSPGGSPILPQHAPASTKIVRMGIVAPVKCRGTPRIQDVKSVWWRYVQRAAIVCFSVLVSFRRGVPLAASCRWRHERTSRPWHLINTSTRFFRECRARQYWWGTHGLLRPTEDVRMPSPGTPMRVVVRDVATTQVWPMNEKQRGDQIRQAVKGDGDALQRLIVEYHKSLHAFVERRMSAALRRHVCPEDILQLAYVEAFKSIERCSFAGPGAFYKWLEKIVMDQLKNAVRDLRRAKRDIRRNLSQSPAGDTSIGNLVERLPSPQSTPSKHLSEREASAAAISSLARLPDHYRQVVQMRFLEDRPVTEIAATLGKSEGAVHMLIKRALDRLSELMGSISQFMSG